MRAILLRAIEVELRDARSPTPDERQGRFKLPLIRSKKPGILKLGEEGVYEYIPFP